ncbi:penicillin-binding protein 2, partial [bacterium]|nr:penicillin-binding protein 2 [bacterium]
ERGTAKSARIEGKTAAGKTGTAQNPHGENHAWFIGFAPFENPEVAMCVLIENGGGGGRNAAPIAGELFKLFFMSQKVDYTEN